MPANAVTVTANFELIPTYTVTFYANGGTPAPANTTVTHDGSITAPDTMTKTGYDFGGWYTNPGFTGSVASFPINNVTANVSLYAKWTFNPQSTDGDDPDKPFLITVDNWEELFAYMRDNPTANKHYRLTEDITVGNWTPIGDATNTFKGTLDGGGHTITGLTITSSVDSSGRAMFWSIDGGEVRNLGLVNVNINVNLNSNIGGIAGTIGSGIIENCFVTGNISINMTGTTFHYIGGIVGYNISGTVKNCYSTATVTSIGTNSTSPNSIGVGGITGFNENGSVVNCVALNDSITAASTNVGRVVGLNSGTLTNNYAKADMTGGGLDKTTTGRDGADVNSTQWEDPDWWENTMNWDFTTIWEWDSVNKLPKLRN